MTKKIRVCCGKTCYPRGSPSIMERLEAYFGVLFGHSTDQVDLDFRSCTGYCERGPNVVVDEKFIIHGSSHNNIVEKIERNEVEEMKLVRLEDIFENDFLGDLKS